MTRYPGRVAVALALAAILFWGCAATARHHPVRLTEQDALTLAVSLANQECRTQYDAAPFGAGTYPVRFSDGRWHWGQIDPGGPGGFSGTVSFDAYGEDRRVQVRFHTDEATPRR
jgi:hypothetical protein